MGSNKFENFIFSLMTCVGMVFIMTWYNGLLESGLNIDVVKSLIMFFPICTVAFIIDWFIVGKVAKAVAFKFISPEAPMIKKVLTITFCMVLGMATCMSLLSTIAHGHLGPHFLAEFGKMWLRNFPFALFLNLAIVGPTVRALFFKIFPPKAVSA